MPDTFWSVTCVFKKKSECCAKDAIFEHLLRLLASLTVIKYFFFQSINESLIWICGYCLSNSYKEMRTSDRIAAKCLIQEWH